MWRASTTRLSCSLQVARCKRQFSLSRQIRANGDKAAPNPPPPAPPAPPAKSSSALGAVLKVVGVSTVGVGGLLGYAWYDSSFRHTLEDNVPYSKEVMDSVFTLFPDRNSVFPDPNACPPPSDAGKPKTKPAAEDTKPLSFTDKKDECEEKPKEAEKKEPALSPKEERQRLLAQRLKEKEEEEISENAALEVILENLLIRVGETSANALEAQRKLVEATRRHITLLKEAMEDTSDINAKDRQWQGVAEAFKDRETLTRESQQLINAAKETLDYLKSAIDEGKGNKVTKKNKALVTAQETLNKMTTELRQMAAEVSKAEADARITTRYKELVDKGRKQFAAELDSIMPEVKLGARAKKLTEEELNSLIAHAHRRIEQLQKQVAEQLALEQIRVEKALEMQKDETERQTNERIRMEIEKMKEKQALDKIQWDAEARLEFEKELRQQLSRQAAAHSDHLKDVLEVQRMELEKQCERELHRQLLQERQAFQTEVAGWIARLKGIESAVEARAESEKIARVAQDLWLACIALNGVIRHGNEEGYNWENRLKPMQKEVDAISDAGGKHPFVETLIQTIPEGALTRGVWTEDSLRERFPKVYRVCRRVAMIDETGGTLFKFFISYLQSFFVFDSVYAKSERDFVDLEKLDTFAILGHAEYWLEKGDLEMAVRFMNQLKGEPRRVASDWIKEAKLLLETRQAAYALTAFASASGLGTIF